MDPKVGLAILRLRSTWDQEVGPSARRALAALFFAVLFGAAHLARVGSMLARSVGAGLMIAIGLALIARAVARWRAREDLRRVVTLTIGKTDRELGAATLRAMTLAERTAASDDAGSPELANLHLSRLLGRASTDRIEGRALAAARRWAGFGFGFAFLALAAVMVEPFRVLEGFDVLLARRGEAPLGLVWLEDLEVTAASPEYLHEGEEPVMPLSATSQPRGSTITVRGRSVHPGRQLVLTDGSDEVGFVDDGASGLVARWTLGDSARLAIAARFGGVRVRQPEEQAVTSIPDLAPTVKLEGAPRTVKLLDEPSIPIHYEVTDDHGLREVHLVLRAGTREERRGLSRPQADAKVDRGGVELRASDPFFKRTYTPVEISVQARDNDPVAGPKWGKSESIIVVPPQVGEPEALRYEALLKARDAMTDLLADRLGQKTAAGIGHVKHEGEAQANALQVLEIALAGTYGGLRVRGRIASLARGQVRRLTKALEAERKSPVGPAHQKLIDETEGVVLALDAATRALGFVDTRTIAKRLADVADEAASAAELWSHVAERPTATARLDAATQVLGGGGKQMLRLGDLGLDLGEIVENDLRRIARAREASDMYHAELAARDLAARLRRPEPSFGGGGKGGVESGSPSSSPPDPSQASSAEQDMAQGEQELEQLARDHEAEMNDVSEALKKSLSAEEIAALEQEAKKHAEAIREAVKSLPPPGGDPGSAESAAAAGREQAEAMAGALERGNPSDASQSGKEAMRALNDAKRLGDQSGGFFPEERAGREAAKAGETVERELAWLEDALQKMRRAASDRAKGDLDKSGSDEEKLAERAKGLAKKGQQGERSMPEEMLDRLEEAEQAMRDAQRSLKEADGDKGLEHQQRAQRALEMAQNQGQDADEKDSDESDGDKTSAEGKALAKKAKIPGKDAHKGPDDFRRRVLEGLGKTSDPVLKQAVKRYAEGLLR